MKRHLRRSIPVALALSICALGDVLAGATHADASQVFRCTLDGHTEFSDTPCGERADPVDVVQSSGGLSPVQGDGLTAQERGDLSAFESRAAQPIDAGGSASGGAPSAPAATPIRHGY